MPDTQYPLRLDHFQEAANPPRSKRRNRRQPPLSIRLTPQERTDLEARAGDLPVSTYAKSLLFAVTAMPNPTITLGTYAHFFEEDAHREKIAEAASWLRPVSEVGAASG